MLNGGVKLTIGGKELNLVLNTEAMAQIADEYGDLDSVSEKLQNARYSEKIRIVPKLIALLATQGEAVKGSNDEITAQFVMLHTMPCDIVAMTAAFKQAVAIGMNISVDALDDDVDEVRAEILKNVQGAAGA